MCTIEDAKEARTELERNIENLLVGFKMQTGLTPSEVRIRLISVDHLMDGRSRQLSSVEVRVEL